MGRSLKILLYFAAAIVALLVVGVVGFMLLFDPNDFRDKIAAETQRVTGRELRIEGDLELSLFPWLAIGIGKTSLGNAPGFDDAPFASFEQARLSVRLLPMLLRREVSVGTAELDSLRLNMAVARDGRNNWQDLVDRGEAAPEPTETTDAGSATLDIASIDIRNASITYSDAQAGESYSLTNVNMISGRVAPGDPVPLSGGLSFELQPAGVSGNVELETVATFDADAGTISLDDLSLDGLIEGVAQVPTTLQFATDSLVADTEQEVLTLGDVEMSVLGIGLSAQVEPFSYAGSPEPVAVIQVEAFSPRSLMQQAHRRCPREGRQHRYRADRCRDGSRRHDIDRIALPAA
jgi:AsmA protein